MGDETDEHSHTTTIAASDPITVRLDRASTPAFEFAGDDVNFRVSLTNGGDPATASNLLTIGTPLAIPYTVGPVALLQSSSTDRMMNIPSGSSQAMISIDTGDVSLSAAPFSNMSERQPLTVSLGSISAPEGNYHTVTAASSGPMGRSSVANLLPYQPVPSSIRNSAVSWITSEFATVNSGENFMEAEVTEGQAITLIAQLSSEPSGAERAECSMEAARSTVDPVPVPWSRYNPYVSTSATLSASGLKASTTARVMQNASLAPTATHADWYVQSPFQGPRRFCYVEY